MSRPALAVVVVAVLVLLAGCAAPVADGTTTPDGSAGTELENRSSDPAGLDVRGGTLPIDENRTYERVQELLGTTFDPPVVYVEEPRGTTDGVYRDPASFYAAVGIGLPDPDDAEADLGVGGVASGFGAVYLLPEDAASPAQVEATLAHELVHVAQFDRDASRRVRAAIPADHRGTTDARLATLSVLEGSATYGATDYADRYGGVEREASILDRLYSNASPGTRLVWGPYLHGSRYVDERTASPAEHWSIYDDPPVTMREVLHGESSANDVESFDVRTSRVGDWTESRRDVLGEFVARQILATELADDRAAASAAGWQYDRLVGFAAEEAALDGYAWTLRFENGTAATTFADDLGAYLDSRSTGAVVDGTPVDGGVAATDRESSTWYVGEYAYSMAAVDGRTVTLFAGAPSFVAGATVEAAGEDVRVIVPENETTDERGALATADETRRVAGASTTEPGSTPRANGGPTGPRYRSPS